MRLFFILAFLAIIALLCVGITVVAGQHSPSEMIVWAMEREFDGPASADPSSVRFSVYSGETAAAIAQRLESEKLIKSALLFRLMAKLRQMDAHIEAGDYQLRRNMTVSEVIDELSQSRHAGSNITIVEGWRAEEIADLLEKRGLARRAALLALVNTGNYDADFLRSRPAGASLEGYLFPDTYRVPPNLTADEAIRLMLKDFGQRFTPAMREQAGKVGLSIHEVVTLASIVEREAVAPEERPIIASVFFNRLRSGMALEADPTVQYAVANVAANQTGEYWKRDLTKSDLQIDSPYNTYRYKGLPPGPICNPGLASINAVLEPSQTDYFYFVAAEDGHHVFAKTLEEHNRNVEKYRK